MTEFSLDRPDAIIARLRAGALSASDFRAAVARPIQDNLSPWELWALVGFLRHERRQKWVGYVVESKLRASGRELGTAGSLGHPESSDDDNVVPDMPGWRYRFHGGGCCLTNDDGTTLDVDFNQDGSALEIDPYFFQRFLETAVDLEWSDCRLRYPSPLENTWHFDLRRLAALGFIGKNWRFSLTEQGRTFGERLEPIIDEINRAMRDGSPERRLAAAWLVTLFGDTLTAIGMLDGEQHEFSEPLRNSSAQVLQVRADSARRALSSSEENDRKLALTALAALGRKHVEAEVWSTLHQQPASSVHLIAIRLVESWADPDCEPNIISILDRFTSNPSFFRRLFRKAITETTATIRPRNGLLVAASRIVFIHNTPTTISSRSKAVVQRVVEGDRAACDAEAGLMLFLLDASKGVAKLKANLRNTVPITRSEAAIFLGMIGTADAIRVLIESADGSPEDGGHEAACVLSLLDNPTAVAAAEQWKRRNDGYEEAEGKEVTIAGRTIRAWKMDEVMRASMREDIRHWAERMKKEYGSVLNRWRQNP